MAQSSSPQLNFVPNNLAESISHPGRFDRYYDNKTILTTTLQEWNDTLGNLTDKTCRYFCRQEARSENVAQFGQCLQNCFQKYEFPQFAVKKKVEKDRYANWRLCVAKHMPNITWDTFYACERQFSYLKQKNEDDLVEEIYRKCEDILKKYSS